MPKKILLADDSLTIQKVISITFSSEDYELTIVGDGDSAVKKAKEARPDLILADVAMPGKSGYEVCNIIKSDPELSNTPVMLLAGTFEPLNKEEAAKVKADDSIVKPFESQELLDKVRELLKKAEVMAEPVEEAAEAFPAAPERKAPSPAVSEDIWRSDDFLGFTEEFEKPKEGAPEPDLSFLDESLFEAPQKELSLPHENDFLDLEFREEDLKAEAPRVEPSRIEPLEPPATEAFEIVEPFDLKTEPPKIEPFEVESFKPEAFEAPSWGEEKKIEGVSEAEKAAQPVETDLLEVPQEELEEARPAEPLEFKRSYPENVRPIRESMEPQPTAFRVPEEQIAEAIEKAAGKVEERFKSGLNERAKGAEAEIAGAIERAAARAEERLKDDISARLEKSAQIPREQVEEIVRSVSKDIIEKIAWEVIPELAEELIKAEINRVKEAIIKLK